MAALTSKQRQFLKGRAHALSPVVRIGKGGVTVGVVAETMPALRSHVLITVRLPVVDGKARREAARRLAEDADAHLVGAVGKVAILYRERDEEPVLRLP
jgi:RNA-binding protein